MGENYERADANPVPRWLQVRFGHLWAKFGHTPFTFDQACETLEESKEIVNVILSRLRQSGWISVAFHEEDFRKRKYTLIEPSIFFKNINEVEKEHA